MAKSPTAKPARVAKVETATAAASAVDTPPATDTASTADAPPATDTASTADTPPANDTASTADTPPATDTASTADAPPPTDQLVAIRMLVGQEGPSVTRVRGQELTIGTDIGAEEAQRLIDADFAVSA